MALRQAQRKLKLLLIDGNNLFHRAYHALPPLTGRDGENSNAVYGFSTMLLKAVSETNPDYVACAFDTAAPTFRHVAFEKYKAQRPAPPPDLYPQLPKVKKVLNAFSVPFFEKAGYEADDLLASIAAKAVNGSLLMVHREKKKAKNPMNDIQSHATKNGLKLSPINVIILSGDRDVLQLVDGYIKVQMPTPAIASSGVAGGPAGKWGTLFGAKEVEEKFGISPAQMVDYKSLTGDPSDNVPGVAGVGPKTASSLLQKYGTVEGIYEHLDEIGGTTQEKLEAGRDLAITAKSLVKLDTSVDLRFKIEDLRYQPDWERVRVEFEELGFKSIVAKIPGGKSEEVVKVSKVSNGAKENNKDQLELL